MNIPNQPNNTLTIVSIIKDGYLHHIEKTSNDSETTPIRGTKINMATMDDYSSINYLNLTDEVRKKYQLEEKDNEQFLRKDCKRYDLTITSPIGRSANISVWVWQGLALKLSFNMAGITSVQEEVTEIQENMVIANEKFDLPENVVFFDRDAKK